MITRAFLIPTHPPNTTFNHPLPCRNWVRWRSDAGLERIRYRAGRKTAGSDDLKTGKKDPPYI